MSTLDDWSDTVCAELGLAPEDATQKTVLNLARVVAHTVDRPAAPLTGGGRSCRPMAAATVARSSRCRRSSSGAVGGSGQEASSAAAAAAAPRPRSRGGATSSTVAPKIGRPSA